MAPTKVHEIQARKIINVIDTSINNLYNLYMSILHKNTSKHKIFVVFYWFL